MDISYYKKYEPIFGSWKIVREIGEGSFGKVFEIEREDFGYTYKAALKVITIPQSQSEVKSALADGMDKASATTYFRGFVEEMVGEFVLMSQLKGISNIVSYEDHRVVEHSDGIGWDILIRMEQLTPLIDYTESTPLPRSEVIKLGIDMCKALEACRTCNIIHRDIKPENIFVSKLGDYKLGDFGIAKTVEKTTGGLSKKGTYTYMAPEVYKGEKYGPSVDIYSLGIVLYRYMNNNRTPFMPDFPQPIKYTDRETALARRVGGEEIPAPVNADAELAKIILKACAYNPKERYSSPTEMREALEAVAAKSVPAPMAEEPAAVEDSSKDDATVGIFSSVKSTVEEESKVAEPSLSGAETVKETPVLPEEDTPEDNGDKTEVIFDNSPNTEEIIASPVKDTENEKREEKVPPKEDKAASAPKKKRKKGLILAAILAAVAIAAIIGFCGKPDIVAIAAGGFHTVELQSDGTVLATGWNDDGQCNVDSWTDIIAVSAGCYHTVGLRSDGTVVAVGYNDYGRCNVDGWTDIVAVSAGCYHTVGLRSDGTVLATGLNGEGQCDVGGWTDIVAVSAGVWHTVGLRSDGTVVAVGDNYEGQCNVDGWTDIIAVSAGGWYTVGLRSDGTVLATGRNYEGQCDVGGWTDIVAVSAGGCHTVGLRSDGTVLAVGYNDDGQCNVDGWTDIIAVSAGGYHTVGLRSDGTVVATGWNDEGQCDT